MSGKFLRSHAAVLRNPVAIFCIPEEIFRMHADVFFLLHSACRSHANVCCRLFHGFRMLEKLFGIQEKNARSHGNYRRNPVKQCRKQTFFLRIPGFFIRNPELPCWQRKSKPHMHDRRAGMPSRVFFGQSSAVLTCKYSIGNWTQAHAG